MRGRSRSKQSQRIAAEIVLESPSLTGGLTDDEAGPLVSWGLAQAEAAADEVRTGQDGAANGLAALLPDDDLCMLVAGRLSSVRRTMKAISRLVTGRHELSAQEVLEELLTIRMLAEDLPNLPALAITDVTLAELAAWQPGIDNLSFVRAILVLLDTG
jgi:hypothetical protein